MNTIGMSTRLNNSFSQKFHITLPYLGILFVSFFESFAFKGQIVLTSDTLYMHSLSKNLLQGGSIFDWNLTQAPDYFPHMFIYLIISLFTQQAAIQLFLITLFQVFLLGALFFLLFRVLGHSRYLSVLESIGLLTLINLFQLHSQDWIYFYKTNNHFSSVVLGLLVLLIVLVAYKSDRFGSLRVQILLFFIVFLGTLSTITFIYAISVPLLCVVTPKVFSRVNFFSPKAFFPVAVIVGTVLALFLTTKTSSGSSLKSRLVYSDSEFILVQDFFMRAFTRNMINSGVIVRMIFIMALATIIFLALAYFCCSIELFPNSENGRTFKMLLGFSIASLFSSTILTILSGGLVDEFFLRFFWPSIFFCGLSALFAVTELLRRSRNTHMRRYPIEIVITVSILILYSVSGKPIYNNGTPFQAAAECVVDLQTRGIKLEGGVADYWYARSVDYLSSSRTNTFAALNTLEPFFWMTTLDTLRQEIRYNYVLLHTNPEPFNFNYDNVKEWLPTPSQKFVCAASDVVVYFYENDSLDILVKESHLSFLRSLE